MAEIKAIAAAAGSQKDTGAPLEELNMLRDSLGKEIKSLEERIVKLETSHTELEKRLEAKAGKDAVDMAIVRARGWIFKPCSPRQA